MSQRDHSPTRVGDQAAGARPQGRLPRFSVAGLVMIVSGLGVAMLAAGYAVNDAWATTTWPWPDAGLSHLFVGSILAAVSVIFIWIGAVGEWGAVPAGALNICIISGGWSIYLLIRAAEGHGQLPYASALAAGAVASTTIGLWARKLPLRDQRKMPAPLRWAFVLFVAVLASAGTSLLLRAQVFPWSVDERSAVMFGCIFWGAATYFLSSLVNPRWHNARGQLLGFLAYDLVLLPRYVVLLGSHNLPYGPQTNFLSLGVYIGILVFSAVVAIYYLFVDPSTRQWSLQERPAVDYGVSR